jgi:hypothetical protein
MNVIKIDPHSLESLQIIAANLLRDGLANISGLGGLRNLLQHIKTSTARVATISKSEKKMRNKLLTKMFRIIFIDK